jgi:hypothetical protein
LEKKVDERSSSSVQSEGPALLALELAAGEKVIWTGYPRSVRRLVVQSVPRAVAGLGLILLTALWMLAVMKGGHNNWDQGRAVAPFAAHNVLIATLAGLWMIPPGIYLLSWPLRTWRKLTKSSYALTERRALVIEPDFLGRTKSHSYPAGSLRLMRVEEQYDGTGDVIFEARSNWPGFAQNVGFLAIDHAGDVEALVRRTLLGAKLPVTHSREPDDQAHAHSNADQKRYRLSMSVKFFQLIFLAAGALLALCVVGNGILFLLLLVLRPQRIAAALFPQMHGLGPLGTAGAIAAGTASLIVGALVSGMFCRFALAFPIEIAIDENRDIHIRCRLHAITIPVGDVLSIKTGEWFDPNRFQAVIRHKSGKIVLVNQFSDFTEFLAAVRDLNPAVKIEGF